MFLSRFEDKILFLSPDIDQAQDFLDSLPCSIHLEGILLHEVQHLIQDVENFARGGNTSEGLLKYYLMAGEVEARNICHRHF